MVSISGLISMPLVIAGLICAQDDLLAQTMLIGTTMFTAGFSTLLQTAVGVR